jgi:outer membrane receptor for ferrienterochelin and colicins
VRPRFSKFLSSGFFAIGIIGVLATTAAAQQPATTLNDILNADLETLLSVEVVSSASKFQQEVREAPAAITVIGADEIRRLGHRTLADALRSVRGFYTTYDRNYSYIGVRGFARPGDYNTRVLLLVDGHRLNDAVYDMAPIGTDFPVDVSLIERIEVIRGPGSSLYGTNAFFAVINVITKGGGKSKGFTVDAGGGALGTAGGTVRYGDVLSGDQEVMVAVSAYRSDGQTRAAYPEFAGEAVNVDRDESVGGTASWSAGPLSLRGAMSDRRKRVPTASFATTFGDARYLTEDRRGYVSAAYEGRVAGWAANVSAAYDFYRFTGAYPLDYGGGATSMWLERAESQVATGDVTLSRRFGAHFVTAGTEVREQFRSRIEAEDESGPQLDLQRPSTVVGVYVQDEMRVRPWMLINAGARVDHYRGFGSYAAPRAALVFLPTTSTAIKILHGRAFRAPNPYERFYYAAMASLPPLQPERIHSTEVVWEQSYNERVRTTFTAFAYRANQIIELKTMDTTAAASLYFANNGRVDALGTEAEVETRLPRGIAARISHSYTHMADDVVRRSTSNAPRQLFKAAVQIPLAGTVVGVDAQYVSERTSVRGAIVPGAFVPNVTLTAPVGSRFEISAAVYNATDTQYSDPGAEEHAQAAIPQDGRTAMLRLRMRF